MTSPALRLRPLAQATFAFLLLLAGLAHAATPTNVVITQVYGAGGNSGALYNVDFIELFNPTGSTITLTNYSVQYSSATGITISAVTNLPVSITLAPGQYYLAAGAAGSNGTALPVTADAPATSISFGATSGKVYLVNSQTKLSSACPATDPGIVDFVAYGAATTCAYGAAAPAPSTTTADIRANGCVANNSSSTEFFAATPSPHNATSTRAPCAVPAANGFATPATITQGDITLLTVSVRAATQPPSTGIAVRADLSAIGGSTTQALLDDGLNGDVTAGDNIFSYRTAVSTAGTYNLPATITDAQVRSASANIPLTVKVPPPVVTIRAIQLTKPSSYAGQQVTTSGIVIGIKSNGFYLEAKDADTTPTTPEGILVHSGATVLPTYIILGAEVQVTGTVSTFPTTSATPGTEIDSPTFSSLSTGNPLPAPIKITAAMDSPTGGIKQFAKFEGMRVAIDSVTTTSGTGASLNEAIETNTSNGRFYGVVTGVARPFREPGISITDTVYTTPIPAGVPLWDSNPEILYFESQALGGIPINVTSNATLTNLSGVMDFSFGSPEIFLDAATRPTVSGLMTAQPLDPEFPTEFTIATFNMERFYNDVADTDNPGSTAVTVTTAAYQRRLAKASLAVRNILNFPDIIGAQEVENLAVLTDLANKISTDATAASQSDPVYKPYLFLANDGTAINTGFLVKSTRVDTLKVEQFGLTTTFTNAGGSQAILNDRTPLVLHAGIKRPYGAPDYPVTVIDVHQRSLINIDDPTSTGITVRLKHEAQSEYLANLIQGYQANGEHVITVGDFNSFEFNDGFVDNLGVIRGNPVPSTQVVTTPAAGIAHPTLVDLVTLLPPAQRQSYVENGSAQVLDHIVVTSDLVPTETRLVFAHMDSDFPLIYLNDATRPERVSDHDPAVAYFTIPVIPGAVSLSASTLNFSPQLLGTTSNTQTITVTNSGFSSLSITAITVNGAFRQTNNCPATFAPAWTCTINVSFAPTATGNFTGTVNILTNLPTSPTTITLAGSGGDFTITPTNPSLTITAGGTAGFPLTLTPLGGYSGPVSFTCSTLTTGETCFATTVPLAPTGTTAASVVVYTTSRYLAGIAPRNPGFQLATLAFGGLGLLGLAGALKRKRLGNGIRLLSLVALLATLGTIAGCSGSSGTVNTAKPNPAGTPAGTQTITITATAGTVSHTTNVTLIVQ